MYKEKIVHSMQHKLSANYFSINGLFVNLIRESVLSDITRYTYVRAYIYICIYQLMAYWTISVTLLNAYSYNNCHGVQYY